MKVQAINTNSNFRGLFTDKTYLNNGNWLMEYQPYSWEHSYEGEIGKMAPKEKLDIFASNLPDNEEIFDKTLYSECSKDIFGTTSYYKESDGKMRRLITQKPAMNREESLKVLNKKYDRFISKKEYKKEELEIQFHQINESVTKSSKEYDNASDNHKNSIFGLGSIREDMDKAKSSLKENADSMFENAKKYVKLINSIEIVKKKKERNSKEIKQIQELRKAGNLIDISVQGIENANAPLNGIVDNMKNTAGKYICLPNRLCSMEEVMKIAKENHLDLNDCIRLMIKRKRVVI